MKVLKFTTTLNRTKVRTATSCDTSPLVVTGECLYLSFFLRRLYDQAKRPMPSISFQKCDCGVEFKIAKLFDDSRQTYRCVCGCDTEIIGSVLDRNPRGA